MNHAELAQGLVSSFRVTGFVSHEFGTVAVCIGADDAIGARADDDLDGLHRMGGEVAIAFAADVLNAGLVAVHANKIIEATRAR